MPEEPAPRGPGPDGDPPGAPDELVYADGWAEWLAAEGPVDEEEFPNPEEYLDPDGPPPPGQDVLTEEEIAGIAAASTPEARAAAFTLGRRGPGQPGSARQFPGERSGPAASFASGMAGDVAPGGPVLAGLADRAAGEDDDYRQIDDDELIGLLCAWDRVEAHAAARKLALVAELIRRRPAPGCAPEGPARMPATWAEFTERELADVLAESAAAAEGLLGFAWDLQVKLPGTWTAFLDGIIGRSKAWIICAATAPLDPAEARAAEALVLGRAGRLTPGALRAAIARAVIEVAPDKARKRRETAARNARVQRWLEDSGNAALMGRELPPAEVLAADQRISARARQLKQAGLDGSMDELRARAYLDILLGQDSRPAAPARQDGDREQPADPGTVAVPAGFAARINLTIPLTTAAGLADRPGEIGGLGPIDPWLARDLAAAAARNPSTTWCVTVTDQDGHAIGHGCARPEPRNHTRHRRKPGHPGQGGPAPPGNTGNTSNTGNIGSAGGPGFTFTPSGQSGPPGGYGTWRLRPTGDGPVLIVALDPIPIGDCDHRYETPGHDPGVKLRHLTQVRYATCTSPTCRRPAAQCDWDHNIPYEQGGRTCSCNGSPKCRRDHRLKQHPRWRAEQLADGTICWITPSGRRYTEEPTRYPI